MLCPGTVAKRAAKAKREKILNLAVRVRPILFIAALLLAWQFALHRHPSSILPGPWGVVGGIADLFRHGFLFKYIVASLFRVTWGFGLAAILAIPLGLTIGWYRRLGMAVNPLVQVFRPISPLAWIPIAILWFGVGDSASDLSDIPGLFLSFVADRYQCGAKYS